MKKNLGKNKNFGFGGSYKQHAWFVDFEAMAGYVSVTLVETHSSWPRGLLHGSSF